MESREDHRYGGNGSSAFSSKAGEAGRGLMRRLRGRRKRRRRPSIEGLVGYWVDTQSNTRPWQFMNPSYLCSRNKPAVLTCMWFS